MTMLLMESAAHANIYPGKWDNLVSAGLSKVTVYGLDALALSFFAGANLDGLYYDFDLADRHPTAILGFRLSTNGDTAGSTEKPIGIWDDAGNILAAIRVSNTDRKLNVINQIETVDTDEVAFDYGAWNYIEIKVVVAAVNGTVEIRWNGNTVYSVTGDTRGVAGANAGQVRLAAKRDQTLYYRDIVIMNGAGTKNNDFLGPVTVGSINANGAGSYSGWTLGAGASQWEAVDEVVPDGDTTYLEATTTGLRSSFTFDDVADLGTGAIAAIQATAVTKYDSAPVDVAVFLRRSATDADGTARTPRNANYSAQRSEVWEDDPIAAAAWSLTNFNLTEFGVKT